MAIRNGQPDRVPVSLGLSEPGPFLGIDNIQFYWERQIPEWKARFLAEHEKFGSDSYLHVVADTSPHDPECEICEVKAEAAKVEFSRIVHTRYGDLCSRHLIGLDCVPSVISPAVNDPEKDFPKALELLEHPDTKDLGEIHAAVEFTGENAHVGFWLPSPIDWWRSLRGAQNMIMDLYDYPELIKKLFSAYREYGVALVEHVLTETGVQSVGIGGSTTSMSVISPEIHREHTLDFGRAVCDKAHEFAIPVQYHMCGKSRQALAITAEMGVDGFDALESPPTGNVDLAEVKKTFGSRISLRGNVNSIHVMVNGSPAEVEKDVMRCMSAAKENGGFILAVGDQMPVNAPRENILALVEYGKKYGEY